MGIALFQLLYHIGHGENAIGQGKSARPEAHGQLGHGRHVQPQGLDLLNLGKHLGRGAVQRDLALVEHDHAVGYGGLFHKMCNPDYRHALLAVELANRGQHVGAARGVQHGGGLIQKIMTSGCMANTPATATRCF